MRTEAMPDMALAIFDISGGASPSMTAALELAAFAQRHRLGFIFRAGMSAGPALDPDPLAGEAEPAPVPRRIRNQPHRG